MSLPRDRVKSQFMRLKESKIIVGSPQNSMEINHYYLRRRPGSAMAWMGMITLSSIQRMKALDLLEYKVMNKLRNKTQMIKEFQ